MTRHWLVATFPARSRTLQLRPKPTDQDYGALCSTSRAIDARKLDRRIALIEWQVEACFSEWKGKKSTSKDAQRQETVVWQNKEVERIL